MEYFISVDWGTSNFRLRVVETDSLKVLYESCSSDGVKNLYELYSSQKRLTQDEYFLKYLNRQLAALPSVFENTPIIISGMASSSIGLKELEYAELPMDSTGKGIITERIFTEEGRAIHLISGVKCKSSMMRGEETQAIGLSIEMNVRNCNTLILTGTHSKHLTYEDGIYTGLESYMTGELFELIANLSILSKSVDKNSWTIDRDLAFKRGVELGFASRLSSSLFVVRAQDLLYKSDKRDNYFLLSGILIGDELAHVDERSARILIAGTSDLIHLYQKAASLVCSRNTFEIVGAEQYGLSVLLGQKRIMEHVNA